MLCRVILGPTRIFYVLPKYGMYNVLCVVTASACNHRSGQIFSLIVFLCLKIDYTCIAQWEKLNPRHLFLFPPCIKRGYYQLSAEYIICATHANYTS